MKASFIIVNYNRKVELRTTINNTLTLLQSDLVNYQLIVVDNASLDGSSAMVKSEFPNVTIIENKVNTGAPAWNLGFAIAKGNYFVVLDDDSHLESGLDSAFEYLDNNQDIGILALNITGGAFQTGEWNNLSQYAGFIGCGAIIRRALYEKIGGYADWIFLYTNEYEYGIRCMEAGFKILYFADCTVRHRTSNINRSSKRLVTYSVKNEMAIVYKYFNKKHRSVYLWRVFLNNLRCVSQHGLNSIPWYYLALKEFLKLKRELKYTPVSAEVEEFYSKDFWSTRRFLGIF
ncbi:MAG: glycosyltransferase [Pedobacter sp.]